ncbi:MAG: hypothetical protein ACI9GW_003481 [Halieaceae bacterium]|jgi:hypothetical protein
MKEKQVTLLKKEGFLKPIIRGWYLLDADLHNTDTGTSVLWHESYWTFIGQYLQEYLGDAYCVSAEQSLDLHTGSNVFPTQLLIGNLKKINRVVKLPRDLSISLYTANQLPDELMRHEGVIILSLEEALTRVGPAYYRRQPQEITLALQSANLTLLLEKLLGNARVTAAGRLAGAFRAVNQSLAADEILSTMQAAGLSVTETAPFDEAVPDITLLRPRSPHAGRIALLWASLADRMAARIDLPLAKPVDIDTAIAKLEETYTNDAYHSLSIEGYRVTPELIERVRSGLWNPDDSDEDQKHLDGLAARGYWEAHNDVKESIRQLHSGKLSVEALRGAVALWYRSLFGPMVRAGVLRPTDLAGYRNRAVFIRGSRHTPLPAEALVDAMETLFECAEKEPHPLTRAVLCHWLIGYIHPFPDGNGRSARFLMNALLVAAGYPWTIIRLETRQQYMAALEELSVNQNPDPFIDVILEAMAYRWTA